MYARNVSTLLQYLVKDGALAIDREDELQAGVLITHDGQVVHPALAPDPEPGPAPGFPPDAADAAGEDELPEGEGNVDHPAH
jgi:hypothetical protein